MALRYCMCKHEITQFYLPNFWHWPMYGNYNENELHFFWEDITLRYDYCTAYVLLLIISIYVLLYDDVFVRPFYTTMSFLWRPFSTVCNQIHRFPVLRFMSTPRALTGALTGAFLPPQLMGRELKQSSVNSWHLSIATERQRTHAPRQTRESRFNPFCAEFENEESRTPGCQKVKKN